MTYSVGSVITASDLNAWLATVNSVWGTGSGNAGYGQPSLLSSVNAGGTVNASHWSSLRAMILASANHQGTSATSLVPTGPLQANNTIFAHVSGTGNNAYDIGNLVSAIYTNRLSSTGMALLSNLYTLTKGASWTSSTTMSFDVTFVTENAARYFFNTGGQIRLRLVSTGTILASVEQQDVDWRDIISNKVGTLIVGAISTERTGSAGIIQNGGGSAQGFYGLNGVPTTIYNGTDIGSGLYSASDVMVSASVLGVAGTNGGNGTTIRFTVLMNDDHTNVTYDMVSDGIQLVVDCYKAGTTNLPTGILTPSFTTFSAWS